MTSYVEKNSINLLTGAFDPDGDPITVRRINGTLVQSWPYSVNLAVGTVLVTEAGQVTYDDGGDTSGHPNGGETLANGSFTYRLWDGALESATYTATIALVGANSSPTGQNHALIFEV